MGSKTMRQNVLHWCQMVRVGKPIEDFGCSFWCLLPLNLGAFKPKKHGPKTKILLGHTHVKPREWELHLGGYFNLHCCMTLPQHHEYMTPSRHQCCDTIEASLLWHHLGIMLWHHRGITSLTPFRHHFFDAIEASFLWHHCGITYLTPLRHHYDTIKKSFLWHHCGITYLTPQRYHYDSIKASFLWHHWGITSLTPLRHHYDIIKASFFDWGWGKVVVVVVVSWHCEGAIFWYHWGIITILSRWAFRSYQASTCDIMKNTASLNFITVSTHSLWTLEPCRSSDFGSMVEIAKY